LEGTRICEVILEFTAEFRSIGYLGMMDFRLLVNIMIIWIRIMTAWNENKLNQEYTTRKLKNKEKNLI